MLADNLTYIIFLIFSGTAILSTLALITRQSLLVAYIALGAVLGPWGLNLISSSHVINQTGDIGILFLLFLLGLDLQPQSLFHSLRKMSLITFISSLVFFLLGLGISYSFGYSNTECLMMGIAMMFSSTIIGIKLLPTTTLHHQHTGELVVSILLLQDVIAIAMLLGLAIITERASSAHLGLIISAFPILFIVAYVFQRYVLTTLLKKFDRIHEYIFILSVAWCLCMAELSHFLGLSEEIGAFMGGVALASNPIAAYIAESLKPLRDFFLIIFFFSIGASFNFGYLPQVFLPACIFAGLFLILKPLVFGFLLQGTGETKKISYEIGIRLGQLSEFSLLFVYMALDTRLLSPLTAYVAQAAIIMTFIVSCYWTVMRYPTPLAATEKLRRD
jgi:Kef-type K+ transport system membrane component KefB